MGFTVFRILAVFFPEFCWDFIKCFQAITGTIAPWSPNFRASLTFCIVARNTFLSNFAIAELNLLSIDYPKLAIQVLFKLRTTIQWAITCAEEIFLYNEDDIDITDDVDLLQITTYYSDHSNLDNYSIHLHRIHIVVQHNSHSRDMIHFDYHKQGC